MVRPTLSSFSVVVAACALAVVSGASVWQPGDAQAILTQSAGLHLMDGHLPRWVGAVVDTAKAIEQKKRVDEDHHRYRQSKPDTPVDITFKNVNDGQGTYAATFFIGTPPQPVTLSLDLLTTDLNVVNHKLDGHQYYDHDKSSSYKANGTKVGAGGIQGFASTDIITFGDPATHNIKLQNQLFIEMTGKDEVLQRLSADGFFGFGRYHESTWINGVRGPIQSLIHNGQLEEPIVGLYMDEQEAHTMIGGIDSMYTSGPVTYFSPAREDFTWGVPVVGVAVGGKTISGGAGRGLITSILAGIGGPKAQVDAIAKAIGVKDGLLACNATTPDVTFQITEDLKVRLTKKDYMWPTPDDNVCEFAMIHSPLSHEWMLGTPFLRNVYTVLDYSKDARTGLAPLRVHA